MNRTRLKQRINVKCKALGLALSLATALPHTAHAQKNFGGIAYGIALIECQEVLAVQSETMELIQLQFIAGMLTGLSLRLHDLPADSELAAKSTSMSAIRASALAWCSKHPKDAFGVGVLRAILDKP